MPAFYFEFLYILLFVIVVVALVFLRLLLFSMTKQRNTHLHSHTIELEQSTSESAICFLRIFAASSFYLCIYILISKWHIDGDDNGDNKKQLHGRIVIFSPAKSHKMATKFSVLCTFFRGPFFVGRFRTFFYWTERKKMQLEVEDDEDNTFHPIVCMAWIQLRTSKCIFFAEDEEQLKKIELLCRNWQQIGSHEIENCEIQNLRIRTNFEEWWVQLWFAVRNHLKWLLRWFKRINSMCNMMNYIQTKYEEACRVCIADWHPCSRSFTQSHAQYSFNEVWISFHFISFSFFRPTEFSQSNRTNLSSSVCHLSWTQFDLFHIFLLSIINLPAHFTFG